MAPTDDVRIRAEAPADHAGVRRVHEAAFGGPLEADLVDAVRADGLATVSLVAARGERVIGHILFSPIDVDGAAAPAALALAPMGVLPEEQRSGVGSRLVRAGLEACRARGVGSVIVLGHPTYYPRFGFAPASGFGLRCPWEGHEEAFFALELRGGALAGNAGSVRYGPAFHAF